MHKKRNIFLSVLLTILSIVYTYLVKTYDVKSIGPNNSEVGFSKINAWFSNLIGSHMTIYKVTELLGYVAILIVGIYGLIGLYQLIKKKSLFKVDKELYILGGLYVSMAVVYVFFEKFIINYRPILIEGQLEASYPSSHTILAICICISSLIVSRNYVRKKHQGVVDTLTILLLLGVLLGRVASGVHWISDILGGTIISSTLLMYFYTLYDYNRYKSRKRRRKR